MTVITKILKIYYLGIDPRSKKYVYEIDTSLGSGKTFLEMPLDFGDGSIIKFDVNKTDQGTFLNNLRAIEPFGEAPTEKKKKI